MKDEYFLRERKGHERGVTSLGGLSLSHFYEM